MGRYDRQKEPARFILVCFLLWRSGLTKESRLLRSLGALTEFGQVQVGAQLVVDLIMQVAVQRDGH